MRQVHNRTTGTASGTEDNVVDEDWTTQINTNVAHPPGCTTTTWPDGSIPNVSGGIYGGVGRKR
ncbi:MAG TPA: hypothetical protein VG276_06455 [Actinomycetes bacterium]|jgi:hypothetical protein|nr:hypothetical protein [Actinomycetes bacterium]